MVLLMIEGVTVHVYRVAKTVVDWFRFRNKVVLDVAPEALRESGRSTKTSQSWPGCSG